MSKRIISACFFIIYSALLIKVMVFKDIPLIRIGGLMFNFGGTHTGPPNFIPFRSILPYFLGKMGWVIGVINIVGNILLLVPIGMLLPVIFPNIRRGKVLLASLLPGFLIEGMQALFSVGIFDVDDIILNALGVILGYFFYLFILRALKYVTLKKLILSVVIILMLLIAVLSYGIHLLKSNGPARPKPDKIAFSSRLVN